MLSCVSSWRWALRHHTGLSNRLNRLSAANSQLRRTVSPVLTSSTCPLDSISISVPPQYTHARTRDSAYYYRGPLRSCRRFIFHSTCARRTRRANVNMVDVRTSSSTCAYRVLRSHVKWKINLRHDRNGPRYTIDMTGRYFDGCQGSQQWLCVVYVQCIWNDARTMLAISSRLYARYQTHRAKRGTRIKNTTGRQTSRK